MNMIKIALMASIAMICVPASAAPRTKVLWIEEPESESYTDKELRRRVAKLERAVAQLQRRIFELEYKEISQDSSIKEAAHTCYIETPFEGLFTATKTSEMEAKAAVAAECSKKTNHSFYCKVDKVKCGV